jgi:hypothetical protein
MFAGKPIICLPGQFTTGRKKLSIETGIKESKIERILMYFEKIEQQIEQRKSSTNRLISVINWDKYQQSEQQSEQRLNNDRTTTEQRLNNDRTTTEQQVNNDRTHLKNDKNEIIKENKILDENENFKNKIEKPENPKTEKKPKPEKINPEIPEIEAFFTDNGFSKEAAKRFFEYYNEANWHDSKGQKVLSWKQKARSVWFKDENKIGNEKTIGQKSIFAPSPSQRRAEPHKHDEYYKPENLKFT